MNLQRLGGRCGGPDGVGAQRLLLLRLRRPLPVLLHRHSLVKGLLPGLFGLRSGGIQGVQHRVIHGVEGLLVVDEFHHRLGGVDIDIQPVGGHGEPQHAAGELPLQQLVAVGLLQRRRQQLALDEPAVDEEQLAATGAVAVEGLGDKSLHGDIAAASADGQQSHGEVPPHGGVHRRLQVPVAGGVQQLHTIPDELEGDLRVAQGQMLHDAADGGPLGRILLHKFHPGGGVVKQVPDADGGTLRAAHLLHLTGDAPLQMQGGPCLHPRPPGEDIHP